MVFDVLFLTFFPLFQFFVKFSSKSHKTYSWHYSKISVTNLITFLAFQGWFCSTESRASKNCRRVLCHRRAASRELGPPRRQSARSSCTSLCIACPFEFCLRTGRWATAPLPSNFLVSVLPATFWLPIPPKIKQLLLLLSTLFLNCFSFVFLLFLEKNIY